MNDFLIAQLAREHMNRLVREAELTRMVRDGRDLPESARCAAAAVSTPTIDDSDRGRQAAEDQSRSRTSVRKSATSPSTSSLFVSLNTSWAAPS